MDINLLTQIGLNDSQAKAYLCLIQYGSLTPPRLAAKIHESRTNAYKILERLEELGLVQKSDASKTLAYRATNPVNLETLAKERRDAILEQEKQVKNAMPTLLNFFYTYSEQPGVRFFQGESGIKQILDDMLRTRQTVRLIRSPSDVEFYDKDYFENYKQRRARLGIHTLALTPDTPSSNRDPGADKAILFERTWLPKDSYSGAADWYSYGSKLAIISYGEEKIGMIIESPIIADSFNQLFGLLQSAYCKPTA